MRKIGVMLAAGLAALAWGYGDLPNTFDASTGYVTMKTRDNTGAGNQAFYFGTHWSDGLPPHSDTNYYVKSGMCLGTPHQNSDVTAQQADDLGDLPARSYRSLGNLERIKAVLQLHA